MAIKITKEVEIDKVVLETFVQKMIKLVEESEKFYGREKQYADDYERGYQAGTMNVTDDIKEHMFKTLGVKI